MTRTERRKRIERKRANCREQGTREIPGGGRKKGGPDHCVTVKIVNLKIGPESRGILSLCSVLELHHTIMSKLWDLGGWTKRKITSFRTVLPTTK